MDFSSLPEAQKQQLQQLQQQFEEHQRQQQQQQEAAQQQQQEAQAAQQQQQIQHQQQIQEYAASQPYDPTQVQSYDQSYYSYYQSQDPQHQPQHQQQQYAYYQADYGNAYQQQQPPQQQSSQIESASGYGVSSEAQPQIVGSSGAPAVQVQPQNVESSGGAATAAQVQHQNAYYPQPVAEAQPAGDQQVAAPVGQSEVNPAAAMGGPPGLNAAAAAAVAALSQLTQFAGTMDAAERAMAELQGLQWHGRGGGYGQMMGPGPGPFMGLPEVMHPPVGRFPFRGGGRRGGGPFRGGHVPKSGGSGSPSRGRGRGRGRGGPKRFPPQGASSSSIPEPDSESKEREEEAEPSGENHEPPVQGSAAPNPRPPQAIRCELCKIECNSLEILEQHNNGKKHRKNLQMAGYPVTEIQKPVSDPNAGVTLPPENANQGNNLPSEAVNGESKVEIDQKNGEAGELELPEEQSTIQETKTSVNRFDNQRRGVKRKMRGGRGGKRVKTFDGPRRVAEPSKPKVVVPIVCDLCNVQCDTQEVFNIHLSGKKHITKLKRYEGHHAMYGPVGLQALYPPNPIAQTSYPQGPQQAYYGPQGPYPPPEAYMPPQAHYAAPAETGYQQSHNPQVS